MKTACLVLIRVIVVGVLPGLGCAPPPDDFCATAGKVELSGGDVTNLAGHYVEARLTSDPSLRASGEIEEDGYFSLDTIHRGQLMSGLPPGKYRLRLILSDDNAEQRRKAAAVIPPRYLQFETSGLWLEVPASDPIVLIQ